MKTVWTKNLLNHDVSCTFCLYSRNFAYASVRGFVDKDGNCLDKNGCKRRAEILKEMTNG